MQDEAKGCYVHETSSYGFVVAGLGVCGFAAGAPPVAGVSTNLNVVARQEVVNCISPLSSV